MATTESITSREFFSIASAVLILGNVAKRHSPEALQDVSSALDMYPSSLLRGAAYLGWVLSQVEEDSRHPEADRDARQALAEISALAAVLVEMQVEATCLRMADEQRRTV